MKWMVALIIVVGLGAGAFYWFGRGVTEPRVGLQIAFGEPQKDGILLEIILASALTAQDPPEGDTRYNSAWQQWVDEHVELVDDSGQKVALRYENQATLSALGVSRGSPDVGFIAATVKTGQGYEVRYRAKAGAASPFRAKIRVPEASSGAQIITLERAAAQH